MKAGRISMKFVEILNTYNPGDIALIKSLLDGDGIVYRFTGEHFNAMEPMVQPARLKVIEDQVERAREILNGFNGSFFAAGFDENNDR